MTKAVKPDRGRDTVSDEEWARVMGDAPATTTAAANNSEGDKAENPGASSETGEAKGDAEGKGNGGYSVGFKKPPKHTQFKKGRSGNPKGRPKGTRNLKTDLLEELCRRLDSPGLAGDC